MEMGYCNLSDTEEVIAALDSLLNKSETHAQKRGREGNQKTPSFLAKNLDKAFDLVAKTKLNGEDDDIELETDVSGTTFQGGTTDVGLHSGCRPRNTSFPLVLSAVHTILKFSFAEKGQHYFDKLVTVYYFHVLENVPSLDRYDARKIDRCVEVMRNMEPHILRIGDQAFANYVVSRLETVKHQLQTLQYGDKPPTLVPTPVNHLVSTLNAPQFPTVTSEEAVNTKSKSYLDRLRAEAKKNINWSDIDASIFGGNPQDAWIQLHQLNIGFWERADALNETNFAAHSLTELQGDLARFSKVVKAATEEAAGHSPRVLTVGIRSYRFLANVICFCWAHKTCEFKFGCFRQYRPAINSTDLKHLVLDDARAVRAMEKVRTFLVSRQSRKKAPFRFAMDTLDLALAYGMSNSSDFDERYNEALKLANSQLSDRWARIKEAQIKLTSLDASLVNAECDLQHKTNALSRSESNNYQYCNGFRQYNAEHYRLQSEKDTAASNVDSLKRKIRNTEFKPENLYVPLPRDKSNACKWLFFVFMPPEFQCLAQLSHSTESCLWNKVPNPDVVKTDLRQWYQDHKGLGLEEAWSLACMGLGSKGSYRADRKPDIRHYHKETCTYFPDFFPLSPVWKNCNPFATRIQDDTSALYTEVLPPCDKKETMQRYVGMHNHKSRENEAIAKREDRPDWLSPEQYIAFSTLRASPRTQLRYLIDCFSDNLLPFDHSCVHTLISQTLLTVGEEDWHTDRKPCWAGISILSELLRGEADRLFESPKNYKRLLLVGTIAAYLGQESSEACWMVARDTASVFKRWAFGAASESKLALSKQVYLQRTIYYGCATLCLGFGPTDASLELARLLVLFQDSLSYLQKGSEGEDNGEVEALDVAVAKLASKNIDNVVQSVAINLSFLTECVRLVDETCPTALAWKPVSYPNVSRTACYEAHADKLYTINLVNGIILFDGNPKSLLPHSIISKPIYKRTFGKANFEITSSRFGIYSTAGLSENRFSYTFSLDSHNELHIYEHDRTLNTKLKLLPKEAMSFLPDHYVEYHSHWYQEQRFSFWKKASVVYRPKSFAKREVSYVQQKTAMYQVPPKHRNREIKAIITDCVSFDRILLGRTAFAKQLYDSGFEKNEFVLLQSSSDSSCIRYWLPRYNLIFEQRDLGIESIDFRGYFVSRNQYMKDTLPTIKAFLMLENKKGDKKVLMPDGHVNGRSGSITLPDFWRDELDYHAYSVHPRFGHLKASDTFSRLHLACLFAATSCSLPDRHSGKPGTEVAAWLLRSSMQNTMFSSKEKSKLVNLSKLSNLSSTLRILVFWAYKCSIVLELPYSRKRILHAELGKDRLAFDEYCTSSYTSPLSLEEERFILGIDSGKAVPSYEFRKLATKSSVAELVSGIEVSLCSEKIPGKQAVPKSLPIQLASADTPIARKTLDDLEMSYKAFSKLPDPFAVTERHAPPERLAKEVKTKRKSAEDVLLKTLNTPGSNAHKLQKVVGKLVDFKPYDILRFVCHGPTVIEGEIHREHLEEVYRSAIEWCLLCVLEDKLLRICNFVDSNKMNEALVEKNCVREWSPFEHPRWLAFEVEEQLQIRPNQYCVVHQLLGSPGAILQLNRGLGKTRVLIPMLVIEYSMERSKKCRVNLLSAIFKEALSYYRQALSSSAQCIRLFLLPFHRDHSLDESSAKILSDEMDKCWAFKGCLLVTPQDRNSLILKEEEECWRLRSGGEVIDILDESDAILDYTFQLVYAIGDQIELSCSMNRAVCLESVIKALVQDFKMKPSVLPCGQNSLASQTSLEGSFPKLRLITTWKDHEKHLAIHLAEAIVADPPYELRWIGEINDNDKRSLVEVIVNSEIDALVEIGRNPLFRKFEADILGLRGYLGFGLLFHGLTQRYKVHYGLRDDSRLAVPYLASDTPKERAEFSHPDMAIVYTYLSYLYDGLSLKQFREAVAALERKGLTLQRKIFSGWIKQIKNDVDEMELRKFDDIGKIDMTNTSLVDMMHSRLGHCMEVVFFWLREIVIPVDTAQFPQRRATSAWNLVQSKIAIGFSGTDDNRFLLPTFVRQHDHKDPELLSTNGYMIEVVLKCTKSTCVLDEKAGLLWKSVLECCFNNSVQALIDVAGLMAGSDIDDVVKHISRIIYHKTECPWLGVVFFDKRQSIWSTFELSNNRSVPLHKSSFHESQCFVYYDESRCRGTDMKLPDQSTALVTLEPKLTKDKFLQGCARMRNLGPMRQRLIFSGTSEVVSPTSTPESILEAILRNTIDATERGLLLYHEHGRCFFDFPSPITDPIELEELYGGPTTKFRDARELLDCFYEKSTLDSTDQRRFMDKCKSLGAEVAVGRSRVGQECEKEVEVETEEEAEEEIECHRCEPALQGDWPFDRVLQIHSLYLVPNSVPLKNW